MKTLKGYIDSELLIMIGFVLLLALGIIGGCSYEVYRKYLSGNQKLMDTTWNYKYADIYLPNGQVKTIEIKTWNDYEGEQIQIASTDGTVYIVSSFNTILRSK